MGLDLDEFLIGALGLPVGDDGVHQQPEPAVDQLGQLVQGPNQFQKNVVPAQREPNKTGQQDQPVRSFVVGTLLAAYRSHGFRYFLEMESAEFPAGQVGYLAN